VQDNECLHCKIMTTIADSGVTNAVIVISALCSCLADLHNMAPEDQRTDTVAHIFETLARKLGMICVSDEFASILGGGPPNARPN
jgi:flavoprotein